MRSLLAAVLVAGLLVLLPPATATAQQCRWSPCDQKCKITEEFTGLRQLNEDGSCRLKRCCALSEDDLARKCRGKCGSEPNAYGGYFQCMKKCKIKYGIND